MNIYNIIIIVLISYLVYKNKSMTLTDITLTIVIIQILLIQYFKNIKRNSDIKENIYNQFNYDKLLNKKIYEYNTNNLTL